MNDAGAAIPASDAMAVRAEATGSLAAICAGTRSGSLSIHSWKYLAAVLRVMESLRTSSEMVAIGASLRQAQTRLRLAAVRSAATLARCSLRVRPLRFVLRSNDQPSQSSSVAARTVLAFSGSQTSSACFASRWGRPSTAARCMTSSEMASSAMPHL